MRTPYKINMIQIILLFVFSQIYVVQVFADFSDVSSEAGLLAEENMSSFGNPTWVDLNNDGLLDMFSSRHNKNMNVYINNGDRTFENVFDTSNLYPEGTWDHHGFGWADFNNDGNMDVIIAEGQLSGAIYNDSLLWLGNGLGEFNRLPPESGIVGAGRTSIVADFNNDGYADFVLIDPGAKLFMNNGNDTFTDKTADAGLDIPTLQDKVLQSGSCVDYDADGDMDIVIGGGIRAKLFANDGQGNFTEVYTFNQTNGVHSHAWGDYDNDGDLDAAFGMGKADYAAGLVEEPSKIIFADRVEDISSLDFTVSGGELTFKLNLSPAINFSPEIVHLGEDKEKPTEQPFTISEAVGEPQIDEDSEPGFYIWNDEGTNDWHVRWIGVARATGYGEIQLDEGEVFSNTTTSYEPRDAHQNIELYRNDGNNEFTLVTEEVGISHVGNHKAGLIWGDYDNDGDLDLYVSDAGAISVIWPNALFNNDGNGNFTNVATEENVTAEHALGRHYGAAWGDYDNDGFLDLFLNEGVGFGTPLSRGNEMLLRNLNKDNGNNNHWLKVDLEGVTTNRAGIGSIIEIESASGKQIRHANGGGGGHLYSQGAGPVHFGLGVDETIDRLTVYWPSGTVQHLQDVQSDQAIRIMEDSTGVVSDDDGDGDGDGDGGGGSLNPLLPLILLTQIILYGRRRMISVDRT
jgi:hypothetical protein